MISVRNIIEQYCLDFLFPRQCLACGTEGCGLCELCRRSLPRLPEQRCPLCQNKTGGPVCLVCRKKTCLTGAWSLLDYSHPLVRRLCNALKHESITELAHLFVPDLEKLIHRQFHGQIDIIMPVPISARRRRERGYNQASLIAQPLAEIMRLPCREDILLRTRNTPAQQNLRKKERLTNLAGAFTITEGLMNKNILLVDDVLTSGTTLSVCAALLSKHGAGQIYGLTLARGKLT